MVLAIATVSEVSKEPCYDADYYALEFYSSPHHGSICGKLCDFQYYKMILTEMNTLLWTSPLMHPMSAHIAGMVPSARWLRENVIDVDSIRVMQFLTLCQELWQARSTVKAHRMRFACVFCQIFNIHCCQLCSICRSIQGTSGPLMTFSAEMNIIVQHSP